MIEELLKETEFKNDCIKLLLYEQHITEKKLKGKKLSKKEEFFDKYLIKPSRLIKFILRSEKNDK